jgi:hypothetical protein
MNDRPIFKKSLETQQLEKLLSDETHEPVFTYEEMSKAAGVDVRDRRGCLQSALRIVQREKGLVFECIANVGMKRANDGEIVEGRSRDVSRIRRVAGRGIKKLECVRDVAALPAERRTQMNVMLSGLSVIKHATSAKAQGAIEQVVIRSKTKLPVAESLAALGYTEK